MKTVTEKQLTDLIEKFYAYTKTAEQHEFKLLGFVDMRIRRTDVSEIVNNQKEARAMYRVISMCIGEDYSDYMEEQGND